MKKPARYVATTKNKQTGRKKANLRNRKITKYVRKQTYIMAETGHTQKQNVEEDSKQKSTT